MADEPSQKIAIKKIWKELSYFEIFIIAISIGYMVYLNSSTSMVLNINNGDETRIINGVQNPPHTILYKPEDYVPKAGVSNTQMVFGIIINIFLISTLLAKRVTSGKRATILEALEDISNNLIKARNLKDARITSTKNALQISTDLEDINLTYNFLTRYRSIGTVADAFKYVIGVEIIDKADNTSEYFKAHYNPKLRYWDGFLKMAKELSEQDQCPKCGNDYDERLIMGQDIRDFREGKTYLGYKGI